MPMQAGLQVLTISPREVRRVTPGTISPREARRVTPGTISPRVANRVMRSIR